MSLLLGAFTAKQDGEIGPWHPLLTGLGVFGRKRPYLFWWLVLSGAVLVAAAMPLAVIVDDDPQLFLHAATAATFYLVTFAFLAPSLGAQARRTFDRSPLLVCSLATPSGAKEIAAGLQHGLRNLALCGFWIAVIIGAGVVLAQLLTLELSLGSLLRRYPFTFSLALVNGAYLLEARQVAASFLLFAVFCVSAFNYAAGIYLHASLLAMRCQLDPRSLVNGAVHTGLLILWMILLQLMYFGAVIGLMHLPHSLFGGGGSSILLGGSTLVWSFSAIVVFIFSGTMRLRHAHRLWKLAAPGEVFESTRSWALEGRAPDGKPA